LNQIAVPAGRTLWLYGEPDFPAGDVYHPRHDQARRLELEGHTVFSDYEKLERNYDAVFVHGPKQHEEAEGLLALALDRSKGFVLAVAPNDAGGTRLRGMMEAFGVPVESLGKSHCKVVWTLAALEADRAVVARKLSQLAPRPVPMEGEAWWTVPGLFSWNQIDPGTRLLLEHLPPDLSGNIADFGCGYGYIAAMLARRYPAIQHIDAYDVDARAVACCARNTGGTKVKAIWQDLATWHATPLYDAVVMNPPFHTGKNEDVGLGQLFVEKAWASLRPGGRLFLVANRHLAYEKAAPGLASIYEGDGYKILTARAP
jgi:16S rRNA (guanine1207-N2)-methyltransferase